jgi:hypothetical protein
MNDGIVAWFWVQGFDGMENAHYTRPQEVLTSSVGTFTAQ